MKNYSRNDVHKNSHGVFHGDLHAATWHYLLPLLAAALLVLQSCSGQKEASSGGSEAGASSFFYGKPADAVGLDPARETDGESFMVTDEIYEGLVGFKPGTTEVQPVLAKSYDISADRLTYTFKLREGVKFHDGSDFNADAAVFAFERQFQPDHPGYDYGPWKFWHAMAFDELIDSVSTEGEYTFVIHLKQPAASFLATLAMDFIRIPSPAAVLKYKDDFTNHPVGTGAYQFVSWKKGDSIVLKAFDGYWGEKANVENVFFRVIPEPTARALALQNGEIDAFTYPAMDDIPALRENPDIDFYETSGLNVGYLAMNNEKKPFDDVRVRQAINYAIDKDDIIKAVYGELGQAADAPIPPIMWAFKSDIKKYEYNPEKARDLLAAAGLADGFETEMLALPVTRPYMPQGQKVAEIVQQQLADVGIRAGITTLEWGAHLEKTDHGDFEMAFLGWKGDNGDPDNFLGVLLAADRAVVPASNIAFWKNEEFTDLIRRAHQISDQEERKKLYFAAQDIFAEEAPWVTIANSKLIVPHKKTVKNLIVSPVGGASNIKHVVIE